MTEYFYVNEEIYDKVLSLKDELINISKNFLYTPTTASNFSHLQDLINQSIKSYNENYFERYGFEAYSSLDIDITKNNIYGGIQFKDLLTHKPIIPCLLNKEDEEEWLTTKNLLNGSKLNKHN